MSRVLVARTRAQLAAQVSQRVDNLDLLARFNREWDIPPLSLPGAAARRLPMCASATPAVATSSPGRSSIDPGWAGTVSSSMRRSSTPSRRDGTTGSDATGLPEVARSTEGR